MTPEDQKHQQILEKYQQLMLDITKRTEVILLVINGRAVSGYQQTNYELVALNFRKIAEAIVYANLVGHKEEYASVNPKYMFDWRMGQILNKIRAINPKFYPRATEQKGERAPGVIVVEELPMGEWMTEDELIEMYDSCADLLHVKNPFQPAVNIDDYTGKFPIWLSKIAKLLNHHIVLLADSRYSIWCLMNDIDTGTPKAHMFMLTSESE